MATVYDFSAKTSAGSEVSLGMFRGQVLLIVNTASRCGFTPQYEGLQKLHHALQVQGFSVLAFPCNQFGTQEPGSDADIGRFCAATYAVDFPLFAKIEVNGANAHPLYRHLKAQRRGIFGTGRVKWNFTKFLVDRSGAVAARYAPATKPDALEAPIRTLL
ncbi:MAG: glutathione peroxidase [Alphaproteobacteria bacterium]|nr:glutathione peroxidase [Alphaproteobacteria bacterium]